MPSASDLQKIQLVHGRFKSSDQDPVRMGKVPSWEKAYRNWHSFLEHKIPRKSNMFVPLTHHISEQMVAFQMQSLFNADGFGKFVATNTDDEDAADVTTALFNYRMRNKVKNVVGKFYRFFQQKTLYGTGIMRTGWNFDIDVVKGRTIIRNNNFELENISARNFFCDPLALDVQGAQWIGCRSFLTKDQFNYQVRQKELRRQMSSDDVDRLLTNRATGSQGSATLISQQGIDYDTVESLRFDPKSEWIELYEYFSIPDNQYLVCTAKEEYLLRDSQIPWDHFEYPFCASQDIPDPEVFWGKSTAENIFNQQAEVNAIRNQRMDRTNFLTNPTFTVLSNGALDRKELINRQGNIIRVKSQEEIQRLDMGNHYMDVDIQNENQAKTDAQVVSQISDYTTANQAVNTATGASIVDQNARTKLLAKVQYFDETCLKPIARQWRGLERQFYDKPITFAADGENKTIMLKDLAKEMDFYGVSEVGAWNKQARQNSTLQFYGLAKGNPAFDQNEIAKDLAVSFGKDARLVVSNAGMSLGALGGPAGSTQIGGGPNPAAFEMAQPSNMDAGGNFAPQ